MERRKNYEFCVICAKPEELRHVMAIFDERFTRRRSHDMGEPIFEVQGPLGSPVLKVRVATAVGMGHLNAAVRTVQMVHSHQPGILFFLGTAASLKPEEIQIGDVVVPRKAVNRIYEKVSEEGQADYDRRTRHPDFKEHFFTKNALISDTATVDCSPDAMALIAGIPINRIELESGASEDIDLFGEKRKLRKPKIFDDVDIFSCGMVVDSVSYREFLTQLADQNMRKVGIIDMESFGFFNAIDAIGATGSGTSTHGVMIRGVSDYAGRKQATERLPDDWKEKAVRNAAIVASALIRDLARLEPAQVTLPT